MSEKRFTYRWGSDIDYEQEIFYDNHKPIGFVEVVGKLNKLYEENEQLKEQVQILNKCCKLKLSDEAIKQAYADLNRREREKHSQGNATYTAKINQNEVIY